MYVIYSNIILFYLYLLFILKILKSDIQNEVSALECMDFVTIFNYLREYVSSHVDSHQVI